MQQELRREQALEYHAKGRPGKIEVIPTKDAKTQRDLSLAFTIFPIPLGRLSVSLPDVIEYSCIEMILYK